MANTDLSSIHIVSANLQQELLKTRHQRLCELVTYLFPAEESQVDERTA